MPELDVVGIGRAPFDMIYVVDHFPLGDDLIRVEEASIQGGGPVPNALCALSRLGSSTSLIDNVGDDWQGEKIRSFLDERNVNIEHLCVSHGCRSTTSTILVQKDAGKRAIINYRGDTPEPNLDSKKMDMIRKARILHVTGTYLNTIKEAINLIKPAGGMVSFDGGAGLFKEADREIIPKVDYCIVAIDYAQKYTGKDSVSEMLDVFISEGVHIAGITNGTDGSWVKVFNGNEFHQPAFLLPSTVDTTGCGDVFHGIFLYGKLNQYPLEKAVQFANAGAAIVSTRLGGSNAPSLDEISRLVNS